MNRAVEAIIQDIRNVTDVQSRIFGVENSYTHRHLRDLLSELEQSIRRERVELKCALNQAMQAVTETTEEQ